MSFITTALPIKRYPITLLYKIQQENTCQKQLTLDTVFVHSTTQDLFLNYNSSFTIQTYFPNLILFFQTEVPISPPSLKVVFFQYQISSYYNPPNRVTCVPERGTVPVEYTVFTPNPTMGRRWEVEGTGGRGGGLQLVRLQSELPRQLLLPLMTNFIYQRKYVSSVTS